MISAVGHEGGLLRLNQTQCDQPGTRRNNREFIPNFGERRRNDKTISTVLVGESTINQVVSRRFVMNKAACSRFSNGLH